MRRPVGESPVGAVGIGVAGLLLIVVAALLVYVTVAFWPPEPTAAVATTYSLQLLTWPLTVSREAGLFVIVASVGALGAMVHSLRSFYWYVGNRELRWSWMLMYVLIPFVGALLAVVFYVVLRGGLISGQATSAAVSPFGFAAVAGLVGLFSDQAVLKLQQVFSVVFTPAEQGKDNLVTPVGITGVEPASGPAGTVVTITGRGLARAFRVDFGAGSAIPNVVSDERLTVVVPARAVSGPVVVQTSLGMATSPSTFTITAPSA